MADFDYESMTVLNEGFELRTSKSGKTRATIRVVAEPLVHVWDKTAMNGGPAQAIAHHYRERIRGITETVSAATKVYREKAAKAFARGAPWAMKRYGGGKTGPMPPNQSDRALNDSGRMAASITASASGKDEAWRVNVAANRLSSDGSGGAERIWNRLVQLIPEFGDVSLLMQSDIVKASIQKATKGIVTKGRATSQKLGTEVVMQVLELVRQGAEIIESISAA